jgi:diketogulonate reductase-like aldo/keto reductase
VQACEQSLRRLGTDRIDLYLLHWPGSVPLDETFEAFQALKTAGKILDYGVSNFDTRGMRRCIAAKGGDQLATNQILYNLMRRGVEWDLLPWQHQHGIPVMAYSPIEHSPDEQFGFLDDPTLESVAHRYAASPAQIAIAWLLHQQDVIVIPKAGRPEHVRENAAAAEIELSSQDLAELDEAFPPPFGPTPLDMR